MRSISLSLPSLEFIVGTRAMLGVGIGLLLASRLRPARRHRVGLALASVGAATTVPAAILLMKAKHSAHHTIAGECT